MANNKTKGAAIALAAAAVLGTGSTFALWGKTANVAGGTITNGTLDVAVAQGGWYDTSADRTDKAPIPGVSDAVAQGHAIDLATWKGVPGDTVMGLFNVDGALSGDNLVANLAVTDQAGQPLTQGTNGWTYTYTLVDAAGNVVGTNNKATNFSTVAFSSSNNGHNVTALPTMDGTIADPTTVATPEYRVLVEATFDPATAGTNEVTDTTDLSGMQIGLNQTRTTTGQGGF